MVVFTNPATSQVAVLTEADGSAVTIVGDKNADGTPERVTSLIVDHRGRDRAFVHLDDQGRPADSQISSNTAASFEWGNSQSRLSIAVSGATTAAVSLNGSVRMTARAGRAATAGLRPSSVTSACSALSGALAVLSSADEVIAANGGAEGVCTAAWQSLPSSTQADRNAWANACITLVASIHLDRSVSESSCQLAAESTASTPAPVVPPPPVIAAPVTQSALSNPPAPAPVGSATPPESVPSVPATPVTPVEPASPAAPSTPEAPIVSVPSPPQPLGPGSIANNDERFVTPVGFIDFTWTGGSGATFYRLLVRDLTTSTITLDVETSTTSYRTTLTQGHIYSWTAKACNGSGCSRESDIRYFATLGPPPLPTIPARLDPPGSATSPGPIYGSTPLTFWWELWGADTRYTLTVRNTVSNTAVIETTTIQSFYTASLPGGWYSWTVKACNDAGCSASTAPLYFVTSGPYVSGPPLVVQTGGAPSTLVRPGPTVDRGQFLSATAAGATSYTWTAQDLTTNTNVLTQTTTGLSLYWYFEGGHSYEWHVQACNTAGCTASESHYFQTLP